MTEYLGAKYGLTNEIRESVLADIEPLIHAGWSWEDMDCNRQLARVLLEAVVAVIVPAVLAHAKVAK